MPFLLVVWIERNFVADRGVGIAGHSGGEGGKTLDECKLWCDETDGCNSIAWRTEGSCWLKKKCLSEDELSYVGNTDGFMSYYKPCTASGMVVLIHGRQYLYKYDSSNNLTIQLHFGLYSLLDRIKYFINSKFHVYMKVNMI